MDAASLLSGPLSQRLTWTLVHFLWQGAAVLVLLWAADVLGAARSMAGRYRLSLAALLLVAVCPVVTFALVRSAPVPVEAVPCELAESAAEIGVSAVTEAVTDRGWKTCDPSLLSRGRRPLEGGDASPLSPNAGAEMPSAPAPPRVTVLMRLQPYLLGGWAIGAGLFALRLLLGSAAAWRTRRGRRGLDGPWAERVARIARRLGLPRARVFLSDRVRQSLVTGLWRPMVLVPAAWLAEMTPEMLEGVLAHELAHLRRLDLWAILLQRLVETFLFYHPAVWWLSHRLSREREMCCDELAVAATGDRLQFAKALEWAAQPIAAGRVPALGAAWKGSQTMILDRIRRVLGGPCPRERFSWWPLGLAALAAPALVLAATLDRSPPSTATAKEPSPPRPPADVYPGVPSAKDSPNIARTYPVNDLLGKIRESRGLDQAASKALVKDWLAGAIRDHQGGRKADMVWTREGLAVEATAAGHAQIPAALAMLAKTSGKQIELRTMFITGPAEAIAPPGEAWKLMPSPSRSAAESASAELALQGAGVGSLVTSVQKSLPLEYQILDDATAAKAVEAWQQHHEVNVLQAPKVTVFNGQPAFVSDESCSPFASAYRQGKPQVDWVREVERVFESGPGNKEVSQSGATAACVSPPAPTAAPDPPEPPASVVEVKLSVLEVDITKLRSAGLDPKRLSELNEGALDALVRDKLATRVAAPHLMTLDGQRASVNMGAWAIDVVPTVVSKDRIRLDCGMKRPIPDGGNRPSAAPAAAEGRAGASETIGCRTEVQAGQTTVLTGLVTKSGDTHKQMVFVVKADILEPPKQDKSGRAGAGDSAPKHYVLPRPAAMPAPAPPVASSAEAAPPVVEVRLALVQVDRAKMRALGYDPDALGESMATAIVDPRVATTHATPRIMVLDGHQGSLELGALTVDVLPTVRDENRVGVNCHPKLFKAAGEVTFVNGEKREVGVPAGADFGGDVQPGRTVVFAGPALKDGNGEKQLVVQATAHALPTAPAASAPAAAAYSPHPLATNDTTEAGCKIAPSDILQLEVQKLVPLPPYHIEPFDVLQITAAPNSVLPDQPINNYFLVDSDGRVSLGPSYGTVWVSGKTIDEATRAIETHLEQAVDVRPLEISVQLARPASVQAISGDYLVAADGTINLRSFGVVKVAGLTATEARKAVEKQLAKRFDATSVSLDVVAHDSMVYYIVTQGDALGDSFVRVPMTGNETVLDALANVKDLSRITQKRVWIARPGPAGSTTDQILPVDWDAITRRESAVTNYQLFPGDRVFVHGERGSAKNDAAPERLPGAAGSGSTIRRTKPGSSRQNRNLAL